MAKRTRIDRFKVKRIMDQRGVGTFEEVAELASVSPTTLYNSIDSYNWSSRTLHRISDALGCSSLDILTEDETHTQQVALAGITELVAA